MRSEPNWKKEWSIYRNYNAYGGLNILINMLGVFRHYQIIKIIKELPENQKYMILDLGCGDGSLTRILTLKGTVIGLDISSEAINNGKKHCSSLRPDEEPLFVLAEISHLPLRSNSLDIIVMSSVLEHIQLKDMSNLCANISELLKNDGIFICGYPMEHKFMKLLLDIIWPSTKWIRDASVLDESKFNTRLDTHKSSYIGIRRVLNNHFCNITRFKLPSNMQDILCYYEIICCHKFSIRADDC